MGTLALDAVALGEILGVTDRTIREWAEKKDMPKASRGQYPARACLEWWLAEIYDSDEDDESLKTAKRKYWQAKGEKEQILTEQLKKSLAPISDVLTAWSARVSIVTSGLEMLTNRLPPLLVGRDRDDIQDTLAAEFRALREQYAARGEHCGETPPMPEPEPAKPPKAVKKQAAKAKAKAKTKPKGIKK